MRVQVGRDDNVAKLCVESSGCVSSHTFSPDAYPSPEASE